MTEDELKALAAMVGMEAVLMQGENDFRRQCNDSIAYRDGSFTPAYWALEAELKHRGILK